jgi:hypothetical protein
MRLDVLVFGGGAAGLWCLDRLRRGGYHALLLESVALGSGQTIQSQGIIHGGGKYALRGVRDFAAVRSTSAMPERWRQSLAGELEPDLTRARLVSAQCYLWLPRGSFVPWLQSFGFISCIARAGLLATPPIAVAKSEWPEALGESALAVYSLAEPVIATASVLQALASHHRSYIFLYDSAALEFTPEGGVCIGEVLLKPRVTLLAAGAGNGVLLSKAGVNTELMQSRPLGMVLLRGALPPLFGHCIVGGKTHLTITTPAPGIWQIGGEIAERLAFEPNCVAARAFGLSEIRRLLPHIDITQAEIAIYRSVRAEARTAASRRPSGVHVDRAAAGLMVAWPTKLSMVPVLADEVFDMLNADLKEPGEHDEAPGWPTPTVARYPWEQAQWFAVS